MSQASVAFTAISEFMNEQPRVITKNKNKTDEE